LRYHDLPAGLFVPVDTTSGSEESGRQGDLMAVKGEEIASKLEERIKQAIDAVVEDIRVSIDDVREVVNQQFDAALQSVVADAKSISLREDLEALLAEETPDEPIEETAAADQLPPAGTSSRALSQAIQEIERGTSQVDVLNTLLDQILKFGSRTALLILKGDTFSGWKGKGFAEFGGNDEAIKRFSASPGQVGELDRLRRDEAPIVWDGHSFSQRASIERPERAVAIPMVIKDKVAAAVYIDRMPESEKPFDQAAVELLIFTTALLIDTLAIRKKTPSPTWSREEDLSPFEAGAETAVVREPAPPVQDAGRTVAIELPPPPPPPAPVEEIPEMPAEPEPEVPRPAPAEPPEPEAESMPEVAPESEEPAMAPPSPPPAPPVQPPPPAGTGGSTQYVPPAGIQGRASAADVSEDAKKHDDARRFARLLVSEIKLYNEGKVDQGRKNRDLYERLKEDIDRSRQMYDDRVSPEVREVSNYFYDELVRILADGNADALGL
jgi:hypothetical protein